MESLEIFMSNVIWLRRHYGFSRSKMAAILKIHVSTLDKIERHSFPPRLDVHILYQIYTNFGYTPSQMVEQLLEETEG